jgi:hypothetical protein
VKQSGGYHAHPTPGLGTPTLARFSKKIAKREVKHDRKGIF